MVFHLGGNALYFNKTLLVQKGVKLPTEYDKQGQWTWATLLEVLKGVSGGQGEMRTWGMNRVESLDLANSWIYSAGGELYDKDITVSQFTNPKTVEAIQYLVDLVVRHRVVPTVAEQGSQGEIFMRGT